VGALDLIARVTSSPLHDVFRAADMVSPEERGEVRAVGSGDLAT
jgi:hypothetical protein